MELRGDRQGEYVIADERPDGALLLLPSESWAASLARRGLRVAHGEVPAGRRASVGFAEQIWRDDVRAASLVAAAAAEHWRLRVQRHGIEVPRDRTLGYAVIELCSWARPWAIAVTTVADGTSERLEFLALGTLAAGEHPNGVHILARRRLAEGQA